MTDNITAVRVEKLLDVFNLDGDARALSKQVDLDIPSCIVEHVGVVANASVVSTRLNCFTLAPP